MTNTTQLRSLTLAVLCLIFLSACSGANPDFLDGNDPAGDGPEATVSTPDQEPEVTDPADNDIDDTPPPPPADDENDSDGDDTDDGAGDDTGDTDDGLSATVTDTDGDGFDALEHGGDDCDDNNAQVHPGAEDDPEDFANALDYNCDGVISADVSKGYFVSPDGDDANDGSADAPFKTLNAAIDTAYVNKKSAVYLIRAEPGSSGEDFIQEWEHVKLPSSINLYGGYHHNADGQLLRASFIDADSGMMINGHSRVGLKNSLFYVDEKRSLPHETPVVSGIYFRLYDAAYVYNNRHSLTLSHCAFNNSIAQLGTAPVVAFSNSVRDTTVTLRHAIIRDEYFHPSTAVDQERYGVLAIAPQGPDLKLVISNSDILSAGSHTKNIGILAQGNVHGYIADSKITARKATESYGLVLGDASYSFTDSTVGGFALERNHITVGGAEHDSVLAEQSSGVMVQNATTAFVARSNVIEIKAVDLDQHTHYGIHVIDSNAWLVNNSISQPKTAVFSQGMAHELNLVNNIFDVAKFGIGVRLDSHNHPHTLAHNLYVTGDGTGSYYQYKTIANVTKRIKRSLSNYEAVSQLNALTPAAVHNVVAPHEHAGLGVGIPMTTQLPGENSRDPKKNFEGKARTESWNIGAY